MGPGRQRPGPVHPEEENVHHLHVQKGSVFNVPAAIFDYVESDDISVVRVTKGGDRFRIQAVDIGSANVCFEVHNVIAVAFLVTVTL